LPPFLEVQQSSLHLTELHGHRRISHQSLRPDRRCGDWPRL